MSAITTLPTDANTSAGPTAESVIEARLEQTRRTLWRSELYRALLILTTGLLGGLWLWTVGDQWLWNAGKGMRLVAAGLLVAGIVFWWLRCFWPIISRKISAAYAARALEHSAPTLSDSLTSYLGLADERESNDLRGAIVRSVGTHAARQLNAHPELELADAAPVARWGITVALAVAILAAYAALSPKDSLRSIARLILPWADLSAPTRVLIDEIEPGDVELLEGQPLNLSARVRSLPQGMVVRAELLSDDEAVLSSTDLTAPPDSWRFSGQLGASPEGIRQSAQYAIRAGDALAGPFQITLQRIPVLAIESVRYEPPRYTELPPRSSDTGAIDGVEGTRVTVIARANRPIRTAQIEFSPREKRPGLWEPTAGVAPATIASDAQRLEVSWVLRHDAPAGMLPIDSYQLRMIDDADNANSDPVRYPVQVRRDLSPEIQIVTPNQSPKSIPLRAQQEIEVRATDPDFGLRRIEIEWQIGARRPQRLAIWGHPRGVTGQQTAIYRLRPQSLGALPGDELTVRARALDNRHEPGSDQLSPNEAWSDTVTLRVVADDATRQAPTDQDGLAPADDQPAAPQQPLDETDANEANGSSGSANSSSTAQDSKTPGSADRARDPKNQAEQPSQTGSSDQGAESENEQSQNRTEPTPESTAPSDANQPRSPQSKDPSQEESPPPHTQLKDRAQQDSQQQGSQQQGSNQQGSNQQGSQQQGSQQEGSQQQQGSGANASENQSSSPQDSTQQSSKTGSQGTASTEGGTNGSQTGGSANAPTNSSGTSSNQSTGGSSRDRSTTNGADAGDRGTNQSQESTEGAEPGGDEGASRGSADRGSAEGSNGAQPAGNQSGDRPMSASGQAEGFATNDGNSDGQQNESTGQAGDRPGDERPSTDRRSGSGQEPSTGRSQDRQLRDQSEDGESSRGQAEDERPGDGTDRQGTEDSSNGSPGTREPLGDRTSSGGTEDSRPESPSEQGAGQSLHDGDVIERIQRRLQEQQAAGAGSSEANSGKPDRSDGSSPESASQDRTSQDRTGNGSSESADQGQSLSRDQETDSRGQSTDQRSASSGDQSSGDQSSGDQSSGDQSSGDQSSGDQSSGDQSSGDQSSGDQSSGDQSNGDRSARRDSAGTTADSQRPGDASSSENPQGSETSEGSNDTESSAGSQAGSGSTPGDSNQPQASETGSPAADSEAAVANSRQTPDGNAPPVGSGTTPGNRLQAGSGEASSDADSAMEDGSPHADAANLDYARKATDLVLDYLDRQREQPDPELLRELRWSADDLRRFVDRWKSAKDLSQSNDPQLRRKFEDQLRSLGLRPPRPLTAGSTATPQGAPGGIIDAGQRSRPPAAYQEAFDAFRRSVGRQ